ncbi:Cna B-type domain-containing protein, partial [Aerococcaceae bacterium NML190938]|nr:Cna B-type domain-containing protein [Aerococcaceae bacterium NML190938]
NIAETAAKQFTITNTYTPEKIGLTGKKTWDDANNQDGKRPDNNRSGVTGGQQTSRHKSRDRNR